ncbi:MAG: hypothetical protein VCC36_08180 [Gammaproteobacteria bacterium]
MLKSGAISSNHVPDSGAGYRQDRRRSDSSVSTPSQPSRRRIAFDPAPQDDFFLPDFCAPRMVLAIVLVVELLALTFALARETVGTGCRRHGFCVADDKRRRSLGSYVSARTQFERARRQR